MTHRISIFLVSLLFLATAMQAQNRAPENLTAEVNHDGNVVLKWKTPTGQVPFKYVIWKGFIAPTDSIAEIYGPSEQFTDFNVKAGDIYGYLVVAEYGPTQQEKFGTYISIRVLPPASGLKFTSIPRSTAVVGDYYSYYHTVNAANPQDISYMLIGAVPDGMRSERIIGGTAWLYWVPDKVGQYNITLQATDQKTGAQAYQEFTITVADKPGIIRGSVTNIAGDPLANSTVRFWTTSPGYHLGYETTTDSIGEFLLDNVQAGQIIAYASEPSGKYAAQFYINAPSVSSAMQLTLKEGDTLNFPFYLLSNPGIKTVVSGSVVDGKGPVENARVSFIRKENFIHIGDTTQIDALWQGNSVKWRESLVDTALTTDYKGEFKVQLPVGRDYYSIVEKDGHIRSFQGDQTNAMEARAIRIANNLRLDYEIPSLSLTSNTVIGKVSSQATGVSKQATVVLIDSELKRGTGGHTYRKYRSVVTDTNGVFVFDNLADSPPSALLAIPMDARLAPQYYHSSGGRSNFRESEELSPLGTVQNIDFELRSTSRSGIGSYFGQVVIRKAGVRTPLPGTLIFAERERDGSIAGYAITDSTGWYSINGLDPDNYLLYADHPEYSYAAFYTAAKPSRIMPVPMTYVSTMDINRVVDVDFVIDDLRTTSVAGFPLPANVELYRNYPNPFNPSTEIRFSLPSRRHVTLRVINTLGETVATLVEEVLDAGLHSLPFNAGVNPSGVYFYQLISEGTILAQRMLLMK